MPQMVYYNSYIFYIEVYFMNYIQTGEVVALHGIKGEVKVYPWADYPRFLEEFDTFYIKKNKTSRNSHNLHFLMKMTHLILILLI